MTGDHAVTAQRVDAASTARKRFAAGKTLNRRALPDRSGKIRGPRKIKDFVGNMIKCDAFMYGR